MRGMRAARFRMPAHRPRAPRCRRGSQSGQLAPPPPQKPSAVLPRAVMPVHGTGRVRRLLLVGVPAAATELPAGAFGDRAALKAAVDAWVADTAAAEATHGSISGWDTSRVDDMSGCCNEGSKGCPSSCSALFPCTFNEAIGGWDTSKVTTMDLTFDHAAGFNSELAWDTSSVTNMGYMFRYAVAFNRPLAWDTSSVTNMDATFISATAFNSQLVWDTSKVTTMLDTFGRANAFNRQLAWDTSSVTDMSYMFHEAEAFNQPLDWDVASVTSFGGMFSSTALEEATLNDTVTRFLDTRRNERWSACIHDPEIVLVGISLLHCTPLC